MTNRALVVGLSLIVVAASVATLAHWAGGGEPTVGAKPSANGPGHREGRSGLVYPEIQGPASLFVDLAKGESAETPVTIHVSASARVPLASGALTLRVPEIAGEPNRTDVLWAGALSDDAAETVTYPLGALPEGQYCFVAIFEFAPDEEGAQPMAISQCLYLDVRPTAILSSNVSFEQILRLELRQELERRILAGLKPKFAAASEDAVANEIARLEAADPGFMDRAVEALIANDPTAARRTRELNERVMEPSFPVHSGEGSASQP